MKPVSTLDVTQQRKCVITRASCWRRLWF